jgi:hypothetical protein
LLIKKAENRNRSTTSTNTYKYCYVTNQFGDVVKLPDLGKDGGSLP